MVSGSIQFASFVLDLDRLCLLGPSGKAELRPKSFEVLRYLIEHAGHVVTKNQVIEAVWPDVTVTDESLAVCVSEIRRALGDKNQLIIKTVPKRGYLLDVPIAATEVSAARTSVTNSAVAEFAPSVDQTPTETATHLELGVSPGERKQVTVLCADIKESLEHLAERDPETALEILEAVLKLMTQAVRRYDGTVIRETADGIMALFGVPVAHEDHAVRACYAALQLQEAVKLYGEGRQRAAGGPHSASCRVELWRGHHPPDRERPTPGVPGDRADDTVCRPSCADGSARNIACRHSDAAACGGSYRGEAT
jgi:DNA-binding winged helix-turn-helix (wHTH) protein